MHRLAGSEHVEKARSPATAAKTAQEELSSSPPTVKQLSLFPAIPLLSLYIKKHIPEQIRMLTAALFPIATINF